MPNQFDPQPVFTLSGISATYSIASLLGVWQASAAPEEITFTSPASVQHQAPVWRADFPRDMSLATVHIARAERSGNAAHTSLLHAEQRLEAVCRGIRTEQAKAVSFGSTPLDPATRELLALLDEIPQNTDMVSYDLRDALGGRWIEAMEQCRHVLDQLRLHLVSYAQVETRIDGRLIGCTVVGWTGDAATTWQRGLAPAEGALHQQTLAAALATRAALFYTVAVITRGATELSKLALVLSTPGGMLLALPAAWRFVRWVLAESSLDQESVVTDDSSHGN
jgi:hypothetical protein